SSTLRQTGNHRLGPGDVSIWRLDRGRIPQAPIRSLLHQEHFLATRSADSAENDQGGCCRSRKMRIVGIGGGTGLPVLLRGLTEIGNGQAPLDRTATVTVSRGGGCNGC